MKQTTAQVATRKGLFEFTRDAAGWAITNVAFVGDPVNLTLTDPRDGALYAALDLGHFGVKLHRRERGNGAAGAAPAAADSNAWQEISVPVYPAQPPQTEEHKGEPAWKLNLIWSLEAGGVDQPGTLWCGTLPGGLFRSRDRGDSWELMRDLWDKPERREWMGGGKDTPGLHSICVDPRDAVRVLDLLRVCPIGRHVGGAHPFGGEIPGGTAIA